MTSIDCLPCALRGLRATGIWTPSAKLERDWLFEHTPDPLIAHTPNGTGKLDIQALSRSPEAPLTHMNTVANGTDGINLEGWMRHRDGGWR